MILRFLFVRWLAWQQARAPSSLEEVGVATEQSHLTQVVVGVPPEEREEGEVGEVGGGGGVVPVSLVNEEDPAEILRQVGCVCVSLSVSIIQCFRMS